MKATLKNVVNNLKQKTGIDLDVYDMLGEKVASTGGVPSYKYGNYSLSDFNEGIIADQNCAVTYFSISSGHTNLIGVLAGTDATSRNYAYMLSALIENALLRSDMNLSRTDNFKSILLNEATKEQVQRFVSKYSVPTLPCYVLAVCAGKDRQGEVLNLLSQFSDAGDTPVVIDDSTIAYIKFYENDSDYQSAVNFADTLYHSMREEINVLPTIGVGTSVKGVQEIATSYEEALAAIRMGNLISSKAGVYSYKEYIMLKMIEDIPKSKLKQYLDSLIDSGVKEILSDNEMVSTAEEFLNNSLNISETSRNLYMHRNTLLYRLDKIEKAMGLNIRRFSDAVTFRIITILYKLLKK